jgi:hypothetical protein
MTNNSNSEDSTETKLQRNLFIGLGGSGQTSLLEIKRSLLEVYPSLESVPEQIQFLAIDTDTKNKPVSTSSGKAVTLEGNEFLQIGRQGSGRVAQEAEWWPEGCADFPTANKGASQKRLHGRAKLAVDASRVKAKISETIKSAKASSIRSLGKDIDKEGLKVWIVCSLAGGTGAGSWYDIAGMVRDEFGSTQESFDELFGVFVTGDVFEGLSTVNSVLPNTYACLKELQWLNTNGLARKAMGESYNLFGVDISIGNDPLLDCVFLATSKNTDRLTINSPSDLFTALGRFLFFFAGEGAVAFGSWWSNKKDIATPVMNSHDQPVLPLFYGLGISEIVLDSENVKQREIQDFTASICESLIGTASTLDDQAKATSDFLEENNFEERHKFDQMLNRFVSQVEMLKQKGKYKVPDSKVVNRPDPEKWAGFIRKTHASDMLKWKERIPQDVDAIVSQFSRDLNDALNVGLSKSGVSNMISFVDVLLNDLELLHNEMAEEYDALQAKSKKADIHVKSTVNSAIKEMGKGFSWRAKSLRCLEDVSKSYGHRLHTGIDSFRTSAAMTCFKLMKAAAEEQQEPLKLLASRLGTARDTSHAVGKKLSRLTQDGFFRQNVDFNDLAGDPERKVNAALLASFLNSESEVLASWLNGASTAESMRATILAFVKAYMSERAESRSLQDWFAQALETENETGRIKKMLASVGGNAKPFWSIQKGFQGMGSDTEKIFLGVEDSATLDKTFLQTLEEELGSDALKNRVSTGDRGRLSMVTVEGPFPAFCVDGVNSWEKSYSNPNSALRSFNLTPHLDARFEGWVTSLNPTPSDTGDMETWALGLILGHIREENNGRFSIKNNRQEGNPDSAGFYWGKTDSTQEPAAFQEFKDNREIVDDVSDFVAKTCIKEGDAKIATDIKIELEKLSTQMAKFTRETPTKIHLLARYKALAEWQSAQ